MLVRSFPVTTDESVSLLLNLPYFWQLKGVTWYDLLSDQFTGLNAIATPGTLRDSLVLLAVVLEQ